MDKKARPIHMLLTRDSPQTQSMHRLKVKGWKKIFHANNREKKADVGILVSDKTDVTRDNKIIAKKSDQLNTKGKK